jgi:alpha-tubulin suppressor-like RCC1 family protein
MPLGSFRLNGLSKLIIIPEIVISGEIFTAGANADGATGLNTTSGNTTTFTKVGSVTTWTVISTDYNRMHVINTSGELWSWGINSSGQLGRGNTTSPQSTPIQTGSATNWRTLDAGDEHTLAINTLGELWAWGANYAAQLGDSSTTQRTSPVKIGSATNWTKVSGGVSHSLALNSAGELWAWGSNDNGKTGLNTTTGNTTAPTKIGSATNWIEISAGGNHSLALNSAGELWAWGANNFSQLGDNTTTDRTTPTKIGSATNWTKISGGNGHSLALNSAGELWAWGNNGSGQVGRGNTTGPQAVPLRIGTASDWKGISAGFSHSFAINNSKQLWGWGINSNGQLGRGNTTSPQTSPTRIGTGSNWELISAGSTQSIGIRSV